jgi:hypothetical protein
MHSFHILRSSGVSPIAPVDLGDPGAGPAANAVDDAIARFFGLPLFFEVLGEPGESGEPENNDIIIYIL